MTHIRIATLSLSIIFPGNIEQLNLVHSITPVLLEIVLRYLEDILDKICRHVTKKNSNLHILVLLSPC